MLIVVEVNVIVMFRYDLNCDFGGTQVVHEGMIGTTEVDVGLGLLQRAFCILEQVADGLLGTEIGQRLGLEVFDMHKHALSATSGATSIALTTVVSGGRGTSWWAIRCGGE